MVDARRNRNRHHNFNPNKWTAAAAAFIHSFSILLYPFQPIEFPRLMLYPFVAFCRHLFRSVTRLAYQLKRLTYCPCATFPMSSKLVDWFHRDCHLRFGTIVHTARETVNVFNFSSWLFRVQFTLIGLLFAGYRLRLVYSTHLPRTKFESF